MTRRVRACIAGLAAILGAGVAGADEGDLDVSFFGSGKMRVAFDRGSTAAGKADHLIDVLLQPDGKLLLFGSSDDDNGLVGSGIARLMPNGGLDNSFDGNGRLELTTFGAGHTRAFALLPDGRIVVAGLTENNVAFLQRRAADGSDASFPGSSFFALPVTLPGATLIDFTALMALPDGKFLGIGTATSGGAGTDFFIARFQSDGTRDPAFGVSVGFTRVNFDLDLASADVPRAIAVASDGRIAVIGEVSAVDREYGIVMLDAAGDPVMTFDGDGRAVVDFDIGMVSDDRGSAGCFMPNGRLLVAGTISDSVNVDAGGFALLGTTGALVAAFGSSGRRSFGVFTRTRVADVVCAPDGKFLATGSFDQSAPTLAPSEAFVTRFLADGSGDFSYGISFGTTGFGLNVSGASGGREDIGLALALDAGGRVYAGFDAQFGGEDYDYGVARLSGVQIFANGFE